MADLVITIPLLPPSVNHYVFHGNTRRHHLSRDAAKFRDDLCLISKGKRAIAQSNRFDVEIRVYYVMRPWQHVPDVDNLPKLVLDGLKAARVFPDDRFISDLQVRRRRVSARSLERTQIRIREAHDDQEEIY